MMQLQQTMHPRKLFVLAGEVSGDLHAAGPVRELLAASADIKVFGVGGRNLAGLGAELLYTTDQMSIMGFVEVLRHAPFLRRVIRDLKKAIIREKPDAALLVDYPGMNLHMAEFLRRQGIPVIYYISPQVWAWKERRVEKIRAVVDRLLVIFDFEVEFYRRHGITAEFVGNPVVEELSGMEFMPKRQFLDQHGFDPESRLVGLLPGSRRQEIEKIFPEMLGAARQIGENRTTAFLLGRAPHIEDALYDRFIADSGVRVHPCRSHEVMHYSDLLLVTSGTATLEALCFGVPMVVLYKTSWLNYVIGKKLVRLNNIALANIVSCGLHADHQVVPELIQHDANASGIARVALGILDDNEVSATMRRELEEARGRLNADSPSRHVAAVLLEYL